jgi:hypothetical protein
MIRALRQHFARRRLARMVEQRRNSFECQDYRKRRAAALKATRGAMT